MYGLKVVRHGACYKHTHPTVLCRIGLMDKIVHYSKMSKTLEKPRKSFPERWEPSQKRAGSVSPSSGGNGARRPVCFSDRPWKQHFTDPFSVYCVLPQTHTTVRISDSCPVSLPWASMQKYTACMAPSCRVGKSRSERRVGGHKGVCRTWPDAEHIPLRPIFTRFPARKHPDIYEFGKN